MRGKIFGLGLSKTGTTSLNSALRLLGFKTRHNPFMMLSCKKGELSINMNKVGKYDGLTDTPVARFYKELDREFPGSKFILTVRDKRSWLNSCERHIWMGRKKPGVMNQLHKDLYGTSFYDEKQFLDAYDKHVKDVTEYFKNRKKDLLVMNICKGDGWEKLCAFLNKPMPKVPFPKSNVGFHRIVNDIFTKFALPTPFKKKVLYDRTTKQKAGKIKF